MVENTKAVVPASTLKTLADNAVEEAQRLEEIGYIHSSATCRKAISETYEILGSEYDKDGEFVSIDAQKLSTLTADSHDVESSRVGRTYLEHYNYW